MKVLGVICSPRKNGNTETMVKAALEGAQGCGAETEFWTTAGKRLKPCDACETCRKTDGKCHINDDLQELFPKIISADGIIFGSPAYFLSASAQAKIVIDRLFSLYNFYILSNKVAGVISVANSQGHEGVLSVFSNFFRISHIIFIDHAFGFAYEKGKILRDKFAMKSSNELGKMIVSFIQNDFKWPEKYRRPLYRVCKEVYGINSYPLRDTK